MPDFMPKNFDLYGGNTHTTLCKKANSTMKFEQMVLGLALAYFHDAIVILRGHNTKRGVYGMLCNRYAMIGYRALLEGDNQAHGGADAVRAKLAFMQQKIYSSTEGMVADSVLTKWLAEFDSSKA
ncbi:hypothetical protein CYMTET_22709 [Cymbomonas tetramitiformis]|uniref:Uncharacterized protein n=1 Tax=Cymbomonas tetramitiformis TaxID=36881 RepID=A0AAE0L1U6_9CHLO|nr:hypothetical protein CYMTET_22709 [Cymbomonas tetramitiformis]